jgi:hypothetical protein
MTIKYGNYVIEPKPYELQAGGWTTYVHVIRDRGGHVECVPYSAKSIWTTRADAERDCINLGIVAIEGRLQPTMREESPLRVQ